MNRKQEAPQARLFWVGGAVILALWVASMTWLLSDLGRGPILTRPTSYGALAPLDSLDLLYRIWAGQRSMGELEYRVTAEGAGRRVTWRMMLQMSAGAASVPVAGDGFSTLDSSGTLASFHATLAIGPQALEVSGTRSDDVLTIRYGAFGVSRARVLQVDSTLAVGDGFFPGLISGCPGRSERLTWQVLDPLTMTAGEVSLERERGHTDPPAPDGGCVVAVIYKGLKTLMWLRRDGIVVRQRTPMGWELILEPDPRDAAGGSTRSSGGP